MSFVSDNEGEVCQSIGICPQCTFEMFRTVVLKHIDHAFNANPIRPAIVALDLKDAVNLHLTSIMSNVSILCCQKAKCGTFLGFN